MDITSFAIGYLAAFVMWMAARLSATREAHPVEPDSFLLSSNRILLIGGIATGAIGIAACAIIVMRRDAHVVHLIVPLTVLLLAVPIAAVNFIEFRRKVIVTSTALYGFSPWRGQRSIRWSELASVTFAEGGGSFKLTSQDGTVLRVNTLMHGIPTFVRALSMHAGHLPLTSVAIANYRRRVGLPPE